jgi:hypothetical protein
MRLTTYMHRPSSRTSITLMTIKTLFLNHKMILPGSLRIYSSIKLGQGQTDVLILSILILAKYEAVRNKVQQDPRIGLVLSAELEKKSPFTSDSRPQGTFIISASSGSMVLPKLDTSEDLQHIGKEQEVEDEPRSDSRELDQGHIGPAKVYVGDQCTSINGELVPSERSLR